jgi:hypothetical protein
MIDIFELSYVVCHADPMVVNDKLHLGSTSLQICCMICYVSVMLFDTFSSLKSAVNVLDTSLKKFIGLLFDVFFFVLQFHYLSYNRTAGLPVVSKSLYI